jgi:CHASE2 domain-containing sensor protein
MRNVDAYTLPIGSGAAGPLQRLGQRGRVVLVSPKTLQVLSLLLIAGAVVLGAFAISEGHWITLSTAVLIILAQGLTIRKARRTPKI